MAEFVFLNANNGNLKVTLEYPDGGGRVNNIWYDNVEPNWIIEAQLFPGGSLDPHIDIVYASTERVLSGIAPGLQQQIVVDETADPEGILVTGFEFIAQVRRFRNTGPGYGG